MKKYFFPLVLLAVFEAVDVYKRQVDVLFHPLHVNRFRDDGNVALHVPSQNHLRRCFTVFFTDSNQPSAET